MRIRLTKQAKRLTFNALCAFAAVAFLVSTAGVLRADEATDQYAVAASFYAKKQWDLAAEEFTALLDRYPGHARAADCVYYLGESLLLSGKIDKARSCFDRYLAEHSNGKFCCTAAFRTGEAAYLAADYPQAKKLLHDFRHRYPQDNLNAYALSYLGSIALAENDAPAAVNAYEQALKQYPQDPLLGAWRMGLARAMVMQGRREEAQEIFQTLAANSHVLLADEARFRLGSLLYNAGQYAQSIEVLAKLTEKTSRKITSNSHWQKNALLLQASALIKLKRFAEAVRPLEAFLDAQPTTKQTADLADTTNAVNKSSNEQNPLAEADIIYALGQLAICHIHAGDFKAAKQWHARLMTDHCRHELLTPTIAQMAEDAYSVGETVWSARLFEWLAEDSGNDEYQMAGLAGLAWSRLQNDQEGLACVAFERLLEKKIDPDLAAESAFTRGQLLEGMERWNGALDMYDRVIRNYEASPRHAQALLAAARLRVKLSKHEAAANLYEQFVRQYPTAKNLDEVLYEWSASLGELGRREQSHAMLDRIHREHPQSRFWADATYRLAAASFDAGNLTHSTELVEQIIAAKPKTDDSPRTVRTEQKAKQNSLVLAYALRLKWQIAALHNDWTVVGQAAGQLLQDCPQSDLCLVAEYWLAESEYRRNQYESAAEKLDILLKKTAAVDEPWAAMVSLRRAQIYALKGQWSQALSLASKILKRFPEFEQQYEVDYLLGRCRASRGEFDEARNAYRRVILSPQGTKTETAAMAQWMIGETYFHQKDYRSALKAYNRVETLYDYPRWQSAALLQAAKCLGRLGRDEQAATLCRRLMIKYPDSPFIEEAARRLRTIRK